VMKFAALRQHEVKTLGADALDDSLAYDQKAILETNLDYITKSLGKSVRPSMHPSIHPSIHPSRPSQRLRSTGSWWASKKSKQDEKAPTNPNLLTSTHTYLSPSPLPPGLVELSLHDPSDPAAPGPADKKKTSKPGKPSIFHYK